MGDIENVTVGYLLTVSVMSLALAINIVLLLQCVLLNANYLLDRGITLIRRIVNGERWNESHNEHFYQRLIRIGRTYISDLNRSITAPCDYFANSLFPKLFKWKASYFRLIDNWDLVYIFSIMPRGCFWGPAAARKFYERG